MRKDIFARAWSYAGLLCVLVGGCASQTRLPTIDVGSTGVHQTEPMVTRWVPPTSGPVIQTAGHETLLPAAPAPPPSLPMAPREVSESQLHPRTVAQALAPPDRNVPVPAPSTPAPLDLDLTGALSIAGGHNPQIAYAAARYREAYARLESARVLWLPTIRAGASFNHHDGTLQETSGNVFDASRSAFQSGLGSGSVGTGSPAVPGLAARFHTADMIYQPKIAAYAASARNAASRSVCNDTLLDASLAYLELLRAVQGLRIAEETREHARSLAELTENFAATGQGPQADADRAEVELTRRRNDVSRAEEAVRVASARLAQVLSLDPTIVISPQEPTIVPIDLVAVADEAAFGDLVATGLSNRPELAEARALVCEAVYQYRREKNAPLIPSVLLGVSESGFGGGTGSEIDNYDSRFDFDAVVYWEIRHLGFGERARRDEASAQYSQRLAVQTQLMDRVAREVVEAASQVRSRRGQIDVAQEGIRAATNSYQRNLTRIREGQGLPIEVLQSLQALDDARREYLRTVIDYNEAQFRLQRALGWPIR